MFVVSGKKKRPSIIKLNNNEPKIDPCGMPLIVSYQSLYEELTFVHCFGFDK